MDHFIELEKLAGKEVMDGGFLSSFQTENLTVAFSKLRAGAEIPLHHHPEEAIDILLEGELEMEINGISSLLKPGMISCVSSNLPHRARAITNCKVVTVLHPRRGL